MRNYMCTALSTITSFITVYMARQNVGDYRYRNQAAYRVLNWKCGSWPLIVTPCFSRTPLKLSEQKTWNIVASAFLSYTEFLSCGKFMHPCMYQHGPSSSPHCRHRPWDTRFRPYMRTYLHLLSRLLLYLIIFIVNIFYFYLKSFWSFLKALQFQSSCFRIV